MSEELIEGLTADLRPTSRLVVVRRLVLGAGLGASVSAVLVHAILGFRPDMDQATGDAVFWVKLAYVMALTGLALWACERLTRPHGVARDRIPWLLAPVLVVALLAAWELMHVQAPLRMPMVMGHSAEVCPWFILAFSLPPLCGLVWAARGLAPARLRLTGALLGLAAGGAGAAGYSLHCDEATASFLLVWYTLGVAGSALIGWLAGPRLLRW